MRQAELPFPQRGGARPGAGRKRQRDRPGVPHRTRPVVVARHPLLVTVRLAPGLPSLRRRAELRVLRSALGAGAERFGMRIVHYCAQSNHLHLLVEAADRAALSRGMKGVLVRLARGWNRLWGRSGSVIADRFHARALASPREVRHALRYVLANHRHHAVGEPGPDPWSSGAWFDGWATDVRWLADRSGMCPVVAPSTWLLTTGWRRHGALRFAEVPTGGRRPSAERAAVRSER